DHWLPSISVTGPMARTVPDLALLLSVQAGYDARAPLSADGDGASFLANLERNFKGARIAWCGDFKGSIPYEPGILDVCKDALKVFETLGCVVEEDQPDYSIEKVWQAFQHIRGWQTASLLHVHYSDPAKRELLKPEAIFEIEYGMKLSAFDISAASVIRT